MGSMRRMSRFLYGIFMLACAVLLFAFPKDGALYVVAIIDIVLLLYGLRMLVYYFTLARFMVGGIMTLYKSIIVIDFGLFVFYLDEIPYRIVMLYLIGLMAFNAIRSILSAFEMKRLGNVIWKRRFAYGVIKLAFAFGSFFVHDSMEVVTIMYSLGLIHAAVFNIESAFKKSAIIYIG